MASTSYRTDAKNQDDADRVILDMKLQELKTLTPQFYIGQIICTVFGAAIFFSRLPSLVSLFAAAYVLYLFVQIRQWSKFEVNRMSSAGKVKMFRRIEGVCFLFGIATASVAILLHGVATPSEQIAIMLWVFYSGIAGGMAIAVIKRASISLIVLSTVPYAVYMLIRGDEASQLVAAVCVAAIPVAIRQYGRMADILTSLSNQKFEADQERLQSDTMLRSFMALASDWAWETDANYDITYFSAAGAEFLNIDRDQAIGQNVFDLIRKSDDPQTMGLAAPLIDALKRKVAAKEVQYYVMDNEGQRHMLQTTAAPEFDNAGQFVGYRGWTSDITDKIESQKALVKSEQMFKDFAESAADWVWVADAELNYTYISDRAFEETGIDPAPTIGKPMGVGETSMPKRDQEIHRAALENRRSFKNVTSSIESSDGSLVWISRCGKPIFDENNIFAGYRGTCRNITKEVEAKQIAEESKAMLAEANKHLQIEVERQTETLRARTTLLDEIIDSMTQGLTVFDKDQRIERSNKKAVILSGLPASCWAPGKSIADLVGIGCKAGVYDNESPEQYFENLYAAIESDGVFEAHRNQRDGRIINESVRARPFGGYVVTYTDVTTQKNRENELLQLSTELEESRDAAEAANRTKSSFLANMSHEIRTPMNGVIGMASLLADSELSSKQQEMAEVIVSSGENLLTIINDILDFSRLEAGKLSIKQEPFNLRSVIEDVSALLTIKVQEKGLEMLVRYDPHLAEHFIGDEARIRQIVTNLLGNAVKFTEEGHILVSVTGKNRGEVADIEVSVEDTGCGIPDEKIDTIFQEFEQVDGSSARKHDGTGLGLAITSRLAAAMDGEVGAISTVDEGSTFSIKIPLPIDENRIDNSAFQVASTDGLCALIVDDNSVNRTILVEQLSAWGIETVTASDAFQALDLLDKRPAATPFNFAIVDFQMPGMDGEELARKIRHNEKIAKLPMIVLTSAGKKHDPEGLNDGGLFDAYLVKPARASMLFNAINSTLQNLSSAQIQQAAIALKAKKQSDRISASKQKNDIKILIAEDNLVNQMVIKAMLEKLNCGAIITSNGREALEQYMSSPPDIVLMDISMPEMDGMEATARIREIQEQRGERIPIVGVTAHAMKEDRQRCIDAGMDDYLSKPVKLEPLTNILEQWTSFKPDEDQTLSA